MTVWFILGVVELVLEYGIKFAIAGCAGVALHTFLQLLIYYW